VRAILSHSATKATFPANLRRRTRTAMTWRPLTIEELREIVAHDLRHCSDELCAYFVSVGFEPAKWQQFPFGDEGNGFWAVASDQGRVLWYNDIEDGFNVSTFTDWGTIPSDEYWCNQHELKEGLLALRHGPTWQMSPSRAGNTPSR